MASACFQLTQCSSDPSCKSSESAVMQRTQYRSVHCSVNRPKHLGRTVAVCPRNTLSYSQTHVTRRQVQATASGCCRFRQVRTDMGCHTAATSVDHMVCNIWICKRIKMSAWHAGRSCLAVSRSGSAITEVRKPSQL